VGFHSATKRTQLLNARSETLFELSSFKHAAAQTRCVLPVNGFVEWQTVENRKYPYFIQHNQLPFLSLAGIYDTWRNAQGLMMYTFSIVTVEANPLMARIHNTKQRMPLILPENAIPTWLNQNTPISSLNQLMIPFPEVDMQAHTVKPLVRLHSSTELRQPYAYPELNLLF
jgi:putative SOS response-associated peptidase YedK